MDWITIILNERGQGAGLSVRGMSRGNLVATLRELTGLYEALPEVQAYDDVVTTTPPRRSELRRLVPSTTRRRLRASAWACGS